MQARIRQSIVVFLALSVLTAVSTTPAPAHAAGVVGTGTPASCTEAALTTALTGGGLVTFNCGGAPHTIVLTANKDIAADTTIDGANLISLSGGTTTRLLTVKRNGNAHLTLRDAGGAAAGAVYVEQAGGTVTIKLATPVVDGGESDAGRCSR